MKAKYPRTAHLPSSPGYTADDERSDGSCLVGLDVVITEKLDGENTSLYADGSSHARSLDSRNHPSRNWVKAFWAERSFKLPVGWRVCGENVYAQHSLAYDSLSSYFYGFSIWNEYNLCFDWDETEYMLSKLEIATVPVLWKGKFKLSIIDELLTKLDLTKVEGLVVRKAEAFNYAEFTSSVAKWVRKGHVQTSTHWMQQEVIPNRLARFTEVGTV